MKIESPRITREEPDNLQLRYDFDQNYVKVDLFLGHRKSEQTVAQLQILTDKASVSSVKKNNKKAALISLCNALLLSNRTISFFNSCQRSAQTSNQTWYNARMLSANILSLFQQNAHASFFINLLQIPTL